MDKWESSIEDYQATQTLDSFSAVLHSAENILKEDLAPFEIDWFIHTLLSEPVSLVEAVSARLADSAWAKVVKDSYKILSSLVDSSYDTVEQYIDDVVKLCQKPQDARTRLHALQCLAACVRRLPEGSATDIASLYTTELGQASTCKAPLALLVGAICEHLPSTVSDQVNTIWRNYLNLLRSNKNTDQVSTAMLKGIWCLFKHFGTEIPVRELTEFYDTLKEFMYCSENAVLAILRDYPGLFKEKLAEDAILRRELWTCKDLSPVLPVYMEIGTVLTKDQLHKVFQTELAPRTRESYAKLRFTALRVCVAYQSRYEVRVDAVPDVDVYSLEFELRRPSMSYDVAEAVAWCIESNVVNSEKLLQTAMMFYNNLPASKRKDIVVNGLLNAPLDVMNTTVTFLINETCETETSLYTLLPVWRDLFASQADGQRALFQKYIENVLLILDNFLDEVGDVKTLPEKLATLLTLTSHVLTLQPVEDYTTDECVRLSSTMVDLSRECGLQASVMAVTRAVVPHLEDVTAIKEIYEMIRIDECKDEALLCESCLALMQSTTEQDSTLTLKALEVIFTRRDAEAKTLSLAIQQLENLIVDQNNIVNKSSVSKCIGLIEKLRARKDLVGKDARVLQRDVTMFLGKYFNVHDVADASSESHMVIVNLKEALSVNIPNPIEGSTYKINLNRILHLALIREHEESLQMLLNIICANLCASDSAVLQAALCRVVVSLCRATVGAGRPNVARQAAAFCDVDSTLYIIKQISVEKSPAVRRMLSETVEGILLKDTGSRGDAAIVAASDHVTTMMGSRHSVLKLGGLDVTEALLPALKANRHHTQSLLPSLMISVVKTYEPTSSIVFEQVSSLYLENIGLFCPEAQEKIIKDLLQILLNDDQEVITDHQVKIHKDLIEAVIGFLNKLTTDVSKLFIYIFKQENTDSMKFVYLWSQIPKYFELSREQVKEIMDFENSSVLDKIFEVNAGNDFGLETHLKFIIQYGEVLFKYYSARTLKYISRVIESLSPKHVKTQRKNLSKCLTIIRQTLNAIPDSILKSLESWTEQLPLKKITEHLVKEKFTSKHALDLNALKIILDIFKLRDPTPIVTTLSILAKTWPKNILQIYANRIKYLKKETPQLSDMLSVSLRFLTVTDVKQLILEGHGLPGVENAKVGVDFCRYFMPVFATYLAKKPFLLVDGDMESCVELLNDVVRWSVRKRWRDIRVENVLELVDQLWPSYERVSTFKSKHSLLLDMSSLNVKVDAHSPAMRWAIGLLRSDDAARDDRIKMVGVLPGGDEYSEAYLRFASLLPTRLSDMDGASRAALRALLDALSGGHQRTLLDVVIILADGDETAGWWDEALPSCMASLAHLPTLTPELVVHVYSRCKASTAVCRRLLVPLIRNSPTPIAEKFFALVLSELISGLSSGVRAPSTHPDYSACVRQKTSILDILQLLFEKISPEKIESPSSSLYENIQTDKPWHVAREVIRLCHKLRDKLIAPDAATPALLRICREFQHSAYKCMCACVCVRRPDAHIYTSVMEAAVWERLVDRTAMYELPLKTLWNTQKIRSSVSICTPSGRRSRSLSRSRIFLRTLSENPFDYDLTQHQTNDTDPQEIEIPESSLNQHPCAGTLTALLRHCAPLPHAVWRDHLCSAMEVDNTNLTWLLAQAVCNCKEDLKPHATHLRPGLFAVAAKTAMQGKYLNSLHIDILNTLILWRDDGGLSAVTLTHVNTAVNCLIYTALDNVARTNIFRMLDEVLENTLKVYGDRVDRIDLVLVDIGKALDDTNRANACLKLLYKFAKNKVRTPGLLSLLLKKLNDNHRVYKREMTILSELIGLQISNSDEQEKTEARTNLKGILEKVRKNNSISDFVRFLYYSGCCDQQQLRTIVDQTQKLPEVDRKKCLRIISKYICSHPGSDEVAEIPVDIRVMVDEISVDRHFEELFTTKPRTITSSSSKRMKLDVPSPTLSTIGRNERRVSEVLSRLASEGLVRVQDVLCKDNLAVRLVECFYINVYLPVMYQSDGKTDLSVCLSSFFEMLFSHVKTQHSFKNKLLRDEPWVVDNPLGLSRSVNRTVGTLRSFAYNNASQYLYEQEGATKIDVQVSIEKILDTFFAFAKVTPEVAMDLLSQLLVTVDGRGFDSRSALAQLLSKMLDKVPRLVELGRTCVDQLSAIDGFSQTVEELKKSSLGSEAEQLCRLLHEETRIRSDGPALFILGCNDIQHEDMDVAMENTEFSVANLVSAFQKLSNWDELTYRQKRCIEAELPTLWTERDKFKHLLSRYTDNIGWFGEAVQLSHGNTQDSMKWLRIIDRWPRRHFVASAVLEACQYPKIQQNDIDVHKLQLPVDIQKSDCLVEWAARLMVRALVINTDNSEDEDVSRKLSRSHELVWCARANEMELYTSALSVIKRNHGDLYEEEIIPWMEQKVQAYYKIGLKRNDSSYLRKALKDATSLSDYYQHSSCEAVIGVNKLIMQLGYRLKSLTHTHVTDIIQVIQSQLNRDNNDVSNKAKRDLSDLYQTAVIYYDGCWSEDEGDKEEIMLRMSEYLGHLFEHNIDGASVAAILLNRLDDCDRISDNTAKVILDKLKPAISNLPTCYMDQLMRKLSLFPAHLSRSSGIIAPQDDAGHRFRRCLQLLCDADFLLLQYCTELVSSLRSDDDAEWNRLFERMFSRIFDNPFAGADYQALLKHKTSICTMKDADSFTRGIILNGCIQELGKRAQRETIRLSHLCPSLARSGLTEGGSVEGCQGTLGNDSGLAKLLGLPKGIEVVKFEEELRVFTDSKRRPTLVCVVTSDGKRRRFLMKSEDLRADAAVQTIKTGHAHSQYIVIPLSEDSGLIQFLEDHKRVRDLMLTVCDVDVPIMRQSAKETELVLAPKSSSVQNYNEMCTKIPAHVLRSAIENHSSSLQDFILKKSRFLESLSEITIINWLFGLGDRHLHNVLYSIQDGGLQCIDWGAIFQYGGCELPPARLTRNLLAVCDINVLEGRLQSILTGLRNSRQLVAPVLKLAFKWKDDFSDQFIYIQSILEGSMVSHDITKDVIRKSNKQHINKYIQLLDSVFDRHQKKDNYAVEEQISCLLRQCTDPWILGVTRNGWEPWL